MKIFHKTACITCKKTISEIQRMNTDIESRDFFQRPIFRSRIKKNN